MMANALNAVFHSQIDAQFATSQLRGSRNDASAR